MHWFLDPITKHYADFEGRVGRQEYWMYVLFLCGIQFVLGALHLDFISMLLSLALLVPNLALASRRLHDIGKSGWWQLLMFIPIVGWIILIVWLATKTSSETNMYGAPAVPKVVGGGVVTSSTPVTNPASDSVPASSNNGEVVNRE